MHTLRSEIKTVELVLCNISVLLKTKYLHIWAIKYELAWNANFGKSGYELNALTLSFKIDTAQHNNE